MAASSALPKSPLRVQPTVPSVSAEVSRSASPSSPPSKKQKMSLTQTYFVASMARTKLGHEASRPDHGLRLLVGHANLLDALMLELADAEKKQEAWFNSTVRKAAKADGPPPRVQWADRAAPLREDALVDDDDASDDGDDLAAMPMPRRLISPPVQISTTELSDDDNDDDDDDDDFYKDEEDDEAHALTRTSSQLPPELVQDDQDSDSDDAPPSPPPQSAVDFANPQPALFSTASLCAAQQAAVAAAPLVADADYYADAPLPRAAPLIATC